MDGKEDDEQQETTQLNIEEAGNAVTAMLQKIRAMDAAQRCAAVVSTSGRLGYTLLHRAVWLGDARAAAELVEVFNADVNMPAQPSGDTPLHIAARQGHTSLLATLLPLGADPTMRNAAGRSAMDVAAAPCRRHLHGGFQTPPERVVLVGDIHGHLAKLQRLWGNLAAKIGEAEFFSSSTHVVFLGDYVDRGPDIKGVLEWLSTLRQRYPQQSHAFVAGNHDFGMACFLGVPPQPCGDDIASRVLQMVPEVTWAASDPKYQERLYDGPLYETMHLQGRRWCMQHRDHFNATATFQAYGVEYGDAPGLRASVPSAHQMFLQQLELVHECQLPASFPGGATRLLAVHAGLEELQPLQLQLAKLRARDCRDGFLEQLTGRHNVLNLHPGLRQIAADGGEATVLASGHHSRLALDLHRSWNVQLHGHGQRMIVDQCGGIASRSLAAVVLSSSGAEVVEE